MRVLISSAVLYLYSILYSTNKYTVITRFQLMFGTEIHLITFLFQFIVSYTKEFFQLSLKLFSNLSEYSILKKPILKKIPGWIHLQNT